MEMAKRNRIPMRTTFTKTANSLEKELKSETLDYDNLALLLEQLEVKGAKLAETDKLILDSLQSEDTSQEDFDHEFDSCEMYADRLIELRVKTQRCLTKFDNDVRDNKLQTSVLDSSISQRKFKLPKIELKKFGGDVKEWLGFWGQFQKIDADPDIALEDKFQYLLQATVPKSKAREIVESFPPTAENYEKAVEHLKTRFGKDEMLVEVYIRNLLRLVLSNAMDSKQNTKLSVLYDQLETQLRALDSLGVASEKYAAMLYPLVESCLPDDIIRTWERNKGHRVNSLELPSNNVNSPNRLSLLMNFLREEVEGEERIKMARAGFGFEIEHRKKYSKIITDNSNENVEIPTAAGLFSCQQGTMNKKKPQCIFCQKEHDSSECRQAKKMTLHDKLKIVKENGRCFKCLKKGHLSKWCRGNYLCPRCKKNHVIVMCPQLETDNKTVDVETVKRKESINRDEVLANKTCKQDVLMQTLTVRLRNKDKINEIVFRALIDSGSQHSYISKQMVNKMGYSSEGQEEMTHGLFGGLEETRMHNRYRIFLSSLDRDYSCNFEAYDQEKICAEIPKIRNGPWTEEAKKYGITFPDLENPRNNHEIRSIPKNNEIHLLIGADICGKLFTGQYKLLSSGLAAMETKLGWTLMGKIPQNIERGNDTSLLVLSLNVRSDKIKDLWELDVLGIKDPAETQTRRDQEAAAEEYFLKTLNRHPDGRYEVSLPWLEGHRPLTNNKFLAIRRLQYTMKTLQSKNLVNDYEAVFADWMTEGIIEPVDLSKLEDATCFYLPHRAVVKEASTTKIRPVFDASAKQKNTPSLNDCLESGPNLIELIPSILNRFRLRKFGVIADIKKAFLQISINEEERDYLRFLWFEEGDPGRMKIYRHNRVVFGINASPFLLAATIAYHLDQVPSYQQAVAQKLKNSMYVDNCITSLETEAEVKHFIEQSKKIMSTAQFDLRGWESNVTEENGDNFADHVSVKDVTPILGLQWNKHTDTLSLMRLDEKEDAIQVSKRTILSTVSKIFDPIGFTIPVTIIPKMILQECWKKKLKWDEEVPVETKKKFEKWKQQLHMLREIEIPRKLSENGITEGEKSLHVFCDASKIAYATCTFFRLDCNGKVSCQLVQAKARVAPLKQISIPRLELLSCVIGARLARSIIDELQIENLKVFYWSDSSNALHWIKRNEQWSIFVANRVREIRQLSDPDDWYHVPGRENPADIPSRGCSVRRLIEMKWWEGPDWLKLSPDQWPKTEFAIDEESIDAERRKTVVTATTLEQEIPWYCQRFSSFLKITRMIAWLYRFIWNAKKLNTKRTSRELSVNEIEEAELTLLRLIQSESFIGINDPALKGLMPLKDEKGLIRLQTRLVELNDSKNFRYPIVLPSKHPAIPLLILEKHRTLSHAGIQILMSHLRENYWILQCRKTVRLIIRNCGQCRRFKATNVNASTAPLPLNRIREAAVFEVLGIDLGGPLYLRSGEKAWFVLFTCAVYRAIHLELVTSLSTGAFLLALRRFIARRGRPKIIYSDNGTNFKGAEHAFNQVNWEKISETATIQRIRWHFIPPTAAWWGGWWERLIRMIKEILRSVLGKARLTYEEMMTVLCEAEGVINNRPLTYLSDDFEELSPLTPALFLREISDDQVPDLDVLDVTSLNRRYRYRLKLGTDIRKRFRNEYLGQLKHVQKFEHPSKQLQVGEIVLVGADNSKRLQWPLAKVLELYPGKDGNKRVAKLKTKNGELLRPIQRLYPLEMDSGQGKSYRENPKLVKAVKKKQEDISKRSLPEKDSAYITRSGRRVKRNERLVEKI